MSSGPSSSSVTHTVVDFGKTEAEIEQAPGSSSVTPTVVDFGKTEAESEQAPGSSSVTPTAVDFGKTEAESEQAPGSSSVTPTAVDFGKTEAESEQAPGSSSVTPTAVDFGMTEAEIEQGILESLRDDLNNPNLQLEDINACTDPGVLAPFREVQNLMWIKRNSVYSTALEEWDRKEKLFSSRVDKKEKRSGNLKNEIYQLVGFFSVFQGVVLTAVSQLAQSQDGMYNTCKKVWSPVILTALAWIVATVGVWQKLSRIETLERDRADEDEIRREAVGRATALRSKGKKFKFILKVLPPTVAQKAFLGYGIWHFWINRFGTVFVSLSLFTGIFISSYFLILCDRGLAPIKP